MAPKKRELSRSTTRRAPALVLCVDIGNTSAAYGIFYKGTLLQNGYRPCSDIPKFISKLLIKINEFPIGDIVISSVVPKMTQEIKKLRLGARRAAPLLWVVGKNLKVRIQHKYRAINKLGSDRLINIYGGIRLYGPPLLILDYGTAVTCDYVSKRGVFMGGLIIPGPEIALEALWERTALLPKIGLSGVRERLPLIGSDTKSGMMAGILQGYGAMADGLVERFRRRYGRRFKVVATGGFARAISPYTLSIDVVDPLLTIRSLLRAFVDTTSISS